MTAPLEYLQPSIGSFWEWADGGRVISWTNDGKTIAFRKQISSVLGRLEVLPPFEAVLLLLAVQRKLWPTRRVFLQRCFHEVFGGHAPADLILRTLRGLDELRPGLVVAAREDQLGAALLACHVGDP